MLDTDTKRRIDTARDILVGKVPDPKSQVEQITIALIYKFMDDLDAEAEEFGGERKFFANDYARYGWAKLMRSGLGGHETLNLYAEAIAKMPENPGIPALFRDIFKNAYLPYRDPETLRSFLKIIDEFNYDHSERLGDAFEYLLSVLGSQGDAGQFRTPRHIIDFMVAVVDPKKSERVLDPACGTAGFLISSFKHILKANTNAQGESTLTPEDKDRLAKNFKGYDISPDMVRLSLVNLYLHGFTDPHVYEYDTLTSEERWNEFADVILANPPFMSPKGGIKPHNRFSVQSKRSEVLFVDYMAEHLTATGRAAIIVPEGIIFQSQTAYKELRKMLVENSLVAVISLPAGCFNPYSGVKTSILLLDKSLARQSDTIAFFKVENDGFGLGAQRRTIEKNDLPRVQAELAAYLQALRSGDLSAKGAALSQPGATPEENAPHNEKGLKARPISRGDGSGLQPSDALVTREPGAMPQAGMGCAVGAQDSADDSADFRVKDPTHTSPGQRPGCAAPTDVQGLKARPIFQCGLIVPKEKIAANGDYNLSGERYREGVASVGLMWPLVPIGDVCIIERGASPRPIHDFITDAPDGVNWIKIGDAEVGAKYITTTKERVTPEGAAKSRRVKPGDFILSNSMSFGRPYVMATDGCIHDGWLLLRDQSPLLDQDFLYNILGSDRVFAQFKQAATGGVVNNLNSEIVRGVKIPLPPLEVQKEIVAEIEGYQKVINGARAVLDHYRPHIPIHPDWPMVPLGDICSLGGAITTDVDLSLPYFGADSIESNTGKLVKTETAESQRVNGPVYGFTGQRLLYSKIRPYLNKLTVVDLKGYCSSDMYPLLPDKTKVFITYLATFMLSDTFNERIRGYYERASIPKINRSQLFETEIPLPPLATQQAIVAEIEAEQALVAANRELITRFEQKIQATLARVWGE